MVSEGEDILAQQRGEMPTLCRVKAEEEPWINVSVAYSQYEFVFICLTLI